VCPVAITLKGVPKGADVRYAQTFDGLMLMVLALCPFLHSFPASVSPYLETGARMNSVKVIGAE